MLNAKQMEARARLKQQGAEAKLDKQFKQVSGAVVRADEPTDDRTIRFCVSTPTPDRSSDVVKPKGGRFENFLKNPVVPWVHDYSQLPVGRGSNVVADESGVYMDKKFLTKDEYEFADTVYRLLKAGFLNTCSIGFLPVKWSWNEERGYWAIDYEEWELLESSICPVPMNPEALQEAKSFDIDLEPMAKWATQLLDVMPSDSSAKRKHLEACYKHASSTPSFHFFKQLHDQERPRLSDEDMIEHLHASGYQIIKAGDDPITQTDEAQSPVRILRFRS